MHIKIFHSDQGIFHNYQGFFIIMVYARKFYIRRNKIKVDSIEKGLIVIAHLLP